MKTMTRAHRLVPPATCPAPGAARGRGVRALPPGADGFIGVGVVHVLGITAALLKIIGPVEAAVLHLGPDILVFLNSVKLTRVRLDEESKSPSTSPVGVY